MDGAFRASIEAPLRQALQFAPRIGAALVVLLLAVPAARARAPHRAAGPR